MNFDEICNIYANQLVIKMAVNTIDSDMLSCSYYDLYFGITFTFLGTQDICAPWQFLQNFCRKYFAK